MPTLDVNYILTAIYPHAEAVEGGDVEWFASLKGGCPCIGVEFLREVDGEGVWI